MDTDAINKLASYFFGNICKNDEFVLDLMTGTHGKTGTQSIHKFAVNKSCGNCFSRDDKDYRGRWKGANRHQDTYFNTAIPFININTKVVAFLCMGGPITYLVHKDLGITGEWILKYILPKMCPTKVP